MCPGEARIVAVICSIRQWQDLIAAVIGAAALVWTVWWTLTRERRRQEGEENSFRIALGTEIRHMSDAAMNAFRTIDGAMTMLLTTGRPITLGWLTAYSQMPEAVVYPQNSDKIGALGPEVAEGVVFFFGQLAIMADSVRRSPLIGEDATKVLVPDQVLNTLLALVQALEAAVKVRLQIPSPRWAERDGGFKKGVEDAARELEALQRKAWELEGTLGPGASD